MLMKPIINRLSPKHQQQLGEVLRFGIVGFSATLIQYGVYLVMLFVASPTLANTIGYAVSFVFNFIASTRNTSPSCCWCLGLKRLIMGFISIV